MKYYKKVAQFEKTLILAALLNKNGNQTKAAKYLGIHRNTLIKKMEKFNIKRSERLRRKL